MRTSAFYLKHGDVVRLGGRWVHIWQPSARLEHQSPKSLEYDRYDWDLGCHVSTVLTYTPQPEHVVEFDDDEAVVRWKLKAHEMVRVSRIRRWLSQ